MYLRRITNNNNSYRFQAYCHAMHCFGGLYIVDARMNIKMLIKAKLSGFFIFPELYKYNINCIAVLQEVTSC